MEDASREGGRHWWSLAWPQPLRTSWGYCLSVLRIEQPRW